MIVSKYEMSIESVFLCVSTLVTSISAFVCSNFKCFKRLLVERKKHRAGKKQKKNREEKQQSVETARESRRCRAKCHAGGTEMARGRERDGAQLEAGYCISLPPQRSQPANRFGISFRICAGLYLTDACVPLMYLTIFVSLPSICLTYDAIRKVHLILLRSPSLWVSLSLSHSRLLLSRRGRSP